MKNGKQIKAIHRSLLTNEDHVCRILKERD